MCGNDNIKHKKKTTMKERTLDYIREFGSITSLEAIRDLGNTRLSGTIYCLKDDGYEFITKYETAKNRWGDSTSFVRYYLKDTDVQEDELEDEY